MKISKTKKLLAYTSAPILGVLIMSGVASADTHGDNSNTHKQKTSVHSHTQKKADTLLWAQAIGMTETDLQTALASEKTLEQIVKEKNLSFETIKQKVQDLEKQQHEAKLAADVASGKITQAQADSIKAARTARSMTAKTELAQKLGITVAELDTKLSQGKTIGDLLKEKGITMHWKETKQINSSHKHKESKTERHS